MSIVTHLIVLFVGLVLGMGLISLFAIGMAAEDEHKDSWRDR